MPYIKKEDRARILPVAMELAETLKTKGDYNYAISLLMHEYIAFHGLRYDHLNDAVGILECAKQEFIRRVVSPYEDKKITENGPVSLIDT